MDDQQPSSGSISVFLITKYTINSVLSLYHGMILLHVMIYVTGSAKTRHVHIISKLQKFNFYKNGNFKKNRFTALLPSITNTLSTLQV